VWQWADGTQKPAILEQLTFNAGLSIDPALSPDGNVPVYASDREGGKALNLWRQRLDGDRDACNSPAKTSM
jgi:Tol biopolymer transport system component